MSDTQQGTPAWFKARQGKLTASRFGAAAGVCAFVTRKKALRLAVGVEQRDGMPDACLHGIKNEQNAVKDYMIRTGNVVTKYGMGTHPDYDWIGGSPDGLVGDQGMIEVKCPYYKQVPHTTIPAHYYCQINGLMQILDRQWCDFVSWTPTKMKIYRVYRDETLWDYLLDKYTVFYAYMKRGCDKIPNMRSEEKAETLRRIADSDEATDYTFWDALEPNALQGRWEAPPIDEFESSDDSSKQIDDGTTNIRKRLRDDHDETSSGPDSTGLGDLHGRAGTEVQGQPSTSLGHGPTEMEGQSADSGHGERS